MTFEERLNEVAELVRLIAVQTAENVRLTNKLEKGQLELQKGQKQIQRSLKSLERIAVAHEKRLNSHETRLRRLQKPKK